MKVWRGGRKGERGERRTFNEILALGAVLETFLQTIRGSLALEVMGSRLESSAGGRLVKLCIVKLRYCALNYLRSGIDVQEDVAVFELLRIGAGL